MPSEVKTGSQRWFLDIRTAPKTPKSLNNYKKRSIRLKKCPSTPVFQQPASLMAGVMSCRDDTIELATKEFELASPLFYVSLNKRGIF